MIGLRKSKGVLTVELKNPNPFHVLMHERIIAQQAQLYFFPAFFKFLFTECTAGLLQVTSFLNKLSVFESFLLD